MKNTVLLVGPNINFLGGVANYYKNILPELKKNKNISLKYLSIGSEISPNLKYILPFIDLFKFIWALLVFRPAIVHVNPSLNIKSIIRDSLFVLFAKLFKSRTIIFFRGWNKKNEYFFSKSILKGISNNLLQADCYIILNDNVKKFLISRNINPNKIFKATTVIPTEYTKEYSLKIKSNNKNGIKKFLFLGRIEKEKGLYELINAIKKYEKKVLLTIVGDGSIWEDLNNKINNDNILKKIVILKHSKVKEEKLDLYLNSDVFILPSYSEGMPNSVLEAMSLNLIVLATTVGAIPDLISSYGGVLMKPQNSKEIEVGIDFILNNYEKLFLESTLNSSKVKNNFSPEIVSNFLCKRYLSLLEKESI